MGAAYVFNIPQFRLDYPAFANETVYPDNTLTGYFNVAGCYIDNNDYGYLAGNCRYLALTLMTAHLTAISDIIASGDIPSLVQSAGIDKVNVSLTPPPVKNQFDWWLSLTAYGQQLLALLQVKSVGGFFIGGGCVRGAFRGGGVF